MGGRRAKHEAPTPVGADEPSAAPAAPATAEEQLLVEALRRHDERAFSILIDRHHNSLLRMAMVYVSDPVVAEEVVQETWLSVLQGIDRFGGRSSLKTWIFSILINRAKTKAQREGRSIPFSALGIASADRGEPPGSSDGYLDATDPHHPLGWAVSPRSWGDSAESRLLAEETKSHVWKAIEGLPAHQRAVITLRDIEGWSSEEVCNVFQLSETNQRVLLHRARLKVRDALEAYFTKGKRVRRA